MSRYNADWSRELTQIASWSLAILGSYLSQGAHSLLWNWHLFNAKKGWISLAYFSEAVIGKFCWNSLFCPPSLNYRHSYKWLGTFSCVGFNAITSWGKDLCKLFTERSLELRYFCYLFVFTVVQGMYFYELSKQFSPSDWRLRFITSFSLMCFHNLNKQFPPPDWRLR